MKVKLLCSLSISVILLGFPGSLVVKKKKKKSANAEDVRDADSIPGSGRSPERGQGNTGVLAWRIPWTEQPGGL